ncbi:conjugal transfer protein TraF [Marinimicrobium locisalis]|uniref:conjugal transfer protein TraF n=1 Tax=Marinimicrobium locisalis TaxID=546022 RepID=UPI0032215C7E
MKKTLLSLALITASGTAVAAEYYNGRLTGMAGAGYATGDYADGVVLNPSLGAAHGENDNFALILNGGLIGDDEDELLDGLEELSDYLEELENRTTSDLISEVGGFDPNNPDDFEQQARALLEEEAEEAIRLLRNVDDRNTNVGASASFVMAFPNDTLSLSVVGKSYLEAAVVSQVDDGDYEYIRNAVGKADFDAAQLDSYGNGIGASVSEVGLAMAKSLKTGEDSRLLLGVTPKYMHIATFVYRADVDSFDEDDFDGNDYTVEEKDVNLDLGATYQCGDMHYALTVANAFSGEYETIDPTRTLKLEPRTTTALGYKGSWLTTEASVDLNTSPNFATGEDTQYARVGAELNAANWAQLRVGFQRDLEDNVADMVSVGVGFSPFNVVNADFAIFAEDLDGLFNGDTKSGGAALQVGLRF